MVSTSAEFLLVLASAAFGGAVTYAVCRHLPDRESPKPDLKQVELFIDRVSSVSPKDPRDNEQDLVICNRKNIERKGVTF